MTTNLFPDVARRWIKRLRGQPVQSETEQSLERAATPEDQEPADNAEPLSGKAKLERSANKNDPKPQKD